MKILQTKGSIIIYALVFGAVAMTVVISGISSYGVYEQQSSERKYDRDLAFHIAEAGIHYYRWHLAHDPTDYKDGTDAEGPYVHPYLDKNDSVIGYYSLVIEPPPSGSSIVTVQSTGWTVEEANIKRTIQARFGFEGFTDYVFLNNSSMTFGFTTVVHGVVHSNGGIRFDGTTDSWVRSAKETYQYENQTHNGVWGGGGPKEFWEYPVSEIDFSSVTGDLSTMLTMADDDGIHLSSSGKEGWHIIFSETGFDLYKVNTRDCYNGEGKWKGKIWNGDVVCEDIGTETFVSTQDIPANGIIFSNDTVWVEGVVDGRVTVAVGNFPVKEPYKNIIITDNLTYKQKASDDVIGLIAQGEIVVPYEVPEDMEINAALLSQFQKNYRPYYGSNEKNSLLIFGSQIAALTGGWKYNNGWGNVISGFVNTNHTYDDNLKFNPPPGFPTQATYELLSWEEIEV